MRRGAVNIEAKRAGCKAAVRGHNSLGGVMACPFHSKDPATLRQWASRGATNFTPAQLLTSPPQNGLPVNAGAKPKPGHRNIGMEIDVEALYVFFMKEPDTSVTFENCTIIDKSDTIRSGDIMLSAGRDGSAVFKDCAFIVPVNIRGDVRIEKSTFHWATDLGSGVHATGCKVSSPQPFTLFEATAEDCEFYMQSNIQMSGESHLIRPRWDVSSLESKSEIFLFDSVPKKGGSVVLDQGGWNVSAVEKPQSARDAVSGAAVSRTNFVDPKRPETRVDKYPLARRRAMAGHPDDPTLAMDADDIEVWDAYLFLDAGKTDDDDGSGVDWNMLAVALDMYGRRQS